MSVDHPNEDMTEFTAEDHLDLLQSNALALALGTISFLRSHGIPATEWTHALGTIFAKAWDTDQAWTPEDFLEAIIINLTAFGGEAIQAEYGDDEAIALIARFPEVERCASLGLEHVEADILYEVITPIARACGLQYRWQREGEHVRITVLRMGNAQ